MTDIERTLWALAGLNVFALLFIAWFGVPMLHDLMHVRRARKQRAQ